MSVLTARTRLVAERLFTDPKYSQLIARLEKECSPAALGCEKWSPEEMERLWFAVLKLCASRPERMDQAFELARVDWRDLLMAAGFGTDLDGHNKWWAEHAT